MRASSGMDAFASAHAISPGTPATAHSVSGAAPVLPIWRHVAPGRLRCGSRRPTDGDRPASLRHMCNSGMAGATKSKDHHVRLLQPRPVLASLSYGITKPRFHVASSPPAVMSFQCFLLYLVRPVLPVKFQLSSQSRPLLLYRYLQLDCFFAHRVQVPLSLFTPRPAHFVLIPSSTMSQGAYEAIGIRESAMANRVSGLHVGSIILRCVSIVLCAVAIGLEARGFAWVRTISVATHNRLYILGPEVRTNPSWPTHVAPVHPYTHLSSLYRLAFSSFGT